MGEPRCTVGCVGTNNSTTVPKIDSIPALCVAPDPAWRHTCASRLRQSCSCSGGCNECTVVLEMDIKNTSDDPLHVTTKHLVSLVRSR